MKHLFCSCLNTIFLVNQELAAVVVVVGVYCQTKTLMQNLLKDRAKKHPKSSFFKHAISFLKYFSLLLQLLQFLTFFISS